MKTQTSPLNLEAVFIPVPRDQLVKFKGRAPAEGHREVVPQTLQSSHDIS